MGVSFNAPMQPGMKNSRMRMKAELLDTIARVGGNPVLPAKEAETLDALALLFPFCRSAGYPRHDNLWNEVNGESRIRQRGTLFQRMLPGIT